MALPDLTGLNIQETYQRVVHTDGTNYFDGTGSLLDIGDSDPFPYTGNAVISGGFEVIGNISGSNTGSFKHLKATTIEGNSPLTIRDVTEITFDNTNLFGNPIFHGDVNVYNASAFLDEADNIIFRSDANDQSGAGNIQFGSSAAGTLIQGNRIILDGPITGSVDINGSTRIESSGSTVFEVVGSEGQLFSITDSLSGSLFAVSDVSGLPILEVFSDDTVKIGSFNNQAIIVNGSTAVVTGSFKVTGSFTAQLPTSSNDTYFLTYNTASYQLEAREVATLINPKVEYLDLTASISSGASITLPNGLSYISSSTYEYLEVFYNGLRLRYDRDFIPTSTTTIQTQLAFPSGSELTFKSLKA